MPGQPGELPKEGGDGKWYWADGSQATWAEMQAIKLQADGYSQTEATNAVNTATQGGTLDPSTGQRTNNSSGSAFPSGTPDTTVTGDSSGVFESMGYLPKLVSSKSPGAELDTSQAGDEQLRMERLLNDLQQQATTGGGQWEQALKGATEKAQATAQSLGAEQQQQSGGNYANALRNIGNAQAGAGQRAAGQAEILRNKSKMGAQDAISAVTSGMGKTAADQAEAQGAARRAVRNVNNELINQAEKTTLGTVSGVAQAAMSDGGRVPGEPQVFGDDERNDTQQAMLSPDEIVIPRSIATDPNAPELAKAFVMAIQQREQGHKANFADGGNIDDEGTQHVGLDELFTPDSKGDLGYQAVRNKYAPTGKPTVEGGGLLDTSQYNKARDAQNQNTALLEQRAAGQGPSVVPQMTQNSADANIEAAMQAQAAGKGGPNLVGTATAAAQGAAGDAGAMAAKEQAAGQEGAAKALQDQMARDNAFAVAQQQAAWNNTLMNVGVGLDQQARLQQLFGAAGQGLAAASSLKFGDTTSDDSGVVDDSDQFSSDDAAWNEAYPDQGDFNTDGGDSQYAAFGGRIKKKRGHEQAFAAARGGRA